MSARFAVDDFRRRPGAASGRRFSRQTSRRAHSVGRRLDGARDVLDVEGSIGTVNGMHGHGRFLLQNVEGHCANQPAEAIGVIGYDNATGRYEAASFDNMGTSISRHVGEMNDAGEMVLHSTYQDQATGATVDRRTVRTMISEREWVETAHETRNGDERKVMEIRAERMDGAVPPGR
jgi:hypothetical protein